MNKKLKYTSLVAAGAVTLGLVGGTLAWFTSQADVTNVFKTGQATNDPGNNGTPGIEVNEDFESPDNMLPGDTETKAVQVTNTASYDQFVRVNIKVRVKEEGKDAVEKAVILKGDKYVVDGYNDIQLNFKEPFGLGTPVYGTGENDDEIISVNGEKQWFVLDDSTADGIEYFYYLGKVKADTPNLDPDTDLEDEEILDTNYTSTLLDSVTLVGHKNTPENNQNIYRNMQFDVIVKADSIQASNNAYADWCTGDDKLKASYEFFENKEDATTPAHGYVGEIVSGTQD